MNALDLLLVLFLREPIEVEQFQVAQTDLRCMVANIWHEARGEDELGWIKVAQTVRNRVKDSEFPTSPCDVIWAKGAFEWTAKIRTNHFNFKPEEVAKVESMIRISASALDGHFDGVINGSLHYYNPAKVTPCWETAFDDSIEHGNHRWLLNPNGTTPCWDKKVFASNSRP